MRHVIIVMRRHDLANKKTMTMTKTKTNTKTMTMTIIKTFGEHPQLATQRPLTFETFDQSDEET